MRAELRGDVEQPAEGAAATRARRGACRGTGGPWGWGQGAARPPARPGVSRARVHLPPLPGTNEHWGLARLLAPGSRLSTPVRAGGGQRTLNYSPGGQVVGNKFTPRAKPTPRSHPAGLSRELPRAACTAGLGRWSRHGREPPGRSESWLIDSLEPLASKTTGPTEPTGRHGWLRTGGTRPLGGLRGASCAARRGTHCDPPSSSHRAASVLPTPLASESPQLLMPRQRPGRLPGGAGPRAPAFAGQSVALTHAEV